MQAYIQDKIDAWKSHVTIDRLSSELNGYLVNNNETALLDAFYKNLEFGTAGLRGILGVGTNRMNEYTVAQATQGLATYLIETYESPSVVIARDSRNLGAEFQKVAASVLAANGVKTYVYPRIEPVPALSFAVRYLGASAGIALTASHNPSQYNGFKAYGSNGCQITSIAAQKISEAIEATDIFNDIKTCDFDEACKAGLIEWIDDSVIDAYIDAVAAQSLPGFQASPNFKVVYTPLNGAGMECVSKILDRIGVTGVEVVAEQRDPNGDFPTCPYPNPEFREALELGLKLCDQCQPDLLLATDPDADRMGVAVPHEGSYKLLTGNEIGLLLIDWLCRMMQEEGVDIKSLVAVSTIVSSDMTDVLARAWGFEMRRVLTGFKYIGEQMDLLTHADEQERFLLAFEESYGYLVGNHVRDKDAVVASMLTVEMASWYADRGLNLYEAMDELYAKHGYYLNGVVNMSFPGAQGAAVMDEIMRGLKERPPTELADLKVVKVLDYNKPTEMSCVGGLQKEESQILPTANVLEFRLENNNKVMVRPSGTEPKIKAYIFSCGESREASKAIQEQLIKAAEKLLSV